MGHEMKDGGMPRANKSAKAAGKDESVLRAVKGEKAVFKPAAKTALGKSPARPISFKPGFAQAIQIALHRIWSERQIFIDPSERHIRL